MTPAPARPKRLGRSTIAAIDGWGITAVAAAWGLLLLALFGERLAPHEAIYFVVEHGDAPRPYDPGTVFALGSDILGRDILSLVLYGARQTLAIVLLAGIARVAAGTLLAALSSWWRPTRVVAEWLSELVSAVPATIVALVLVKIFVRTDTTILVFVGALLLIGWAGPYRVIRAEVDRLRHAGYSEGALAIGVGRWRMFWRHQLPHLVPVVVTNLSQQVVASLVLVAEMGVLGAFVGTTRLINVEESLTRVLTGPQNSALIADPPEWGGLLANARSVEALWTTRWLILVPGVAFALTAIAVALIGLGLARRYARRDVLDDLRGRGAVAVAALVVGAFVVSSLVPERYAEAREWAAAAREHVRPAQDVQTAFAEAGLQPVGPSYAVERRVQTIAQTGPATVAVGAATHSEPWPRRLSDMPDRERTARAFVSKLTGGGSVEAPLVFAGRGISTADIPAAPAPVGVPVAPDAGRLIRQYAYGDDYAGIDVRGKVVLLVRFLGIAGTGTSRSFQGNPARGPQPEDSVAKAIERGAAAVILVDPALSLYSAGGTGGVTYGLGDVAGGLDPYLRAERSDPPVSTGGAPVVVIGPEAAATLLVPLGLDLSPYYRFDERGAARYKTSPARELGVSARVQVPLERRAATAVSYVAEVASVPADEGRIVVWAVRRSGASTGADVLAALARTFAGRRVPFVLVDFDPAVDPAANARAIREVLGERRLALLIVLDGLEGGTLRFTTASGDLVAAFDLYAERAATSYTRTAQTARIGEISQMLPFPDVKTVIVNATGEGGATRHAAALIGYLAGRLALGAEEVPR